MSPTHNNIVPPELHHHGSGEDDLNSNKMDYYRAEGSRVFHFDS